MNRLATAFAVAIAMVTGLVAVPSASAAISCKYVAAGADGASGNRIEIKVTRFEEAVAVLPGRGQNIQVTDDQRMKPVKCVGGKPTMVNIDQVNLLVDRKASGTSLFVGQAPKFGPGATPEEEGGKGITFVAKGLSYSFGIGGTAQHDVMWLGSAGKATAFDYEEDGPFDNTARSDIDAFLYAKKHLNVLVRGGMGHDLIIGSPNHQTPLDGPLEVPISLYGEEGRDQISGGNGDDYVDGGPGNDMLMGFAGADELAGGPGRDWFHGGPGRDEIDAIDGIPAEPIDCGAGKDLVHMDLKDDDKHCESFRFP